MSIIYTSAGASVNDATTTVSGKVRLATIAEAGGTSEALAVTPAGLQAEISGAVSGTQYKGAVAYDAIATTLASASVGDMYRLSSTGSAHGYDFTIGDLIIVNTDMGGTFDANKIDRFDTTDADLATVATTGSSTDLTDTASLIRTSNTASTTSAGIVEIADNTETSAGTSTTLAVSPASLANELGNLASTDLSDTASLIRTSNTASTTSAGIVEIADNTETSAGTSTTLAVSPASLANELNNLTTSASGYPVATLNTTNTIDAVVNTAYYSLNAQVNDNTFLLPDQANLSDGDVIIFTRRNVGDIILKGFDHQAQNPAQLIEYFGSSSATRTITCNNQQIYVRYESGSPKWYIFDKAQAVVATTGSSTDLTDTASLIRTSNTASTTSAGIVEIADNTETSAGTSTTLAVSPASLANELGNLASTDLSDTASLIRTSNTASTTSAGIVEIADNTETSAGTSTTLAVSPASLANELNNLAIADLSNVSYTAGSNIDNYVLTYDHSTTSWTAEEAQTGQLTIESKNADFTASQGYFYLVETTSGNTITCTLPTSGNTVGDRIKVFNHGAGTLRILDPGFGVGLDPADGQVGGAGNERYINSRALVELIITSGFTYEYVITPQLELDESTLTTTGQVFAYNSSELAMKALPYTFPSADGSANQILSTNSSGVLSFVDQPSVVDDSSPQLGGDLDTNQNELVTASNRNLILRPNGTGAVQLGGNTNPAELQLYCETSDQHYVALKAPTHSELSGGGSVTWRLPTADATTSGDALVSDGSGNLSFTTISGGSAPSVINDNSGSDTTISTSTGIEEIHLIDNSSNNVVITIPTTSAGYKYQIKRLGTGTVSVQPSSGTIDANNSFSLASRYDSVTLVSDGTNYHII